MLTFKAPISGVSIKLEVRWRKKVKFHGIFRGKFAEKSANFTGFSRGKKSKFAGKSADFTGFSRGKVKICGKIGWFRGILAEKSQISKDS